MKEQIVIREYLPEDKPNTVQLIKLNVPNSFAESEVKDLEKYLENEIERYFVVELDGKLMGAGGINFEDNYKVGKISWDFINPQSQRLGIGSQLLNHRLELLKSMNSIETILVRTSQHAYKFYEKNGFVLEEIHKDYWADGFDMYKMVYDDLLYKNV